jgi:hypothetical protein
MVLLESPKFKPRAEREEKKKKKKKSVPRTNKNGCAHPAVELPYQKDEACATNAGWSDFGRPQPAPLEFCSFPSSPVLLFSEKAISCTVGWSWPPVLHH